MIGWHPNTFFKHDAIDATKMVGKDRKTCFQAECFEIYEPEWIHRTIAIFIGAEIIGTLVKDDLFVELGEQKLRCYYSGRRCHKQSMLSTCQHSCDCPC